MPDDHTLLELVKISGAPRDALREAHELARPGESGEPLRETLHYARDLLDLANETLAGDPQAGEHARGMALHMAEQLAAVEALLGRYASAFRARRRGRDQARGRPRQERAPATVGSQTSADRRKLGAFGANFGGRSADDER